MVSRAKRSRMPASLCRTRARGRGPWPFRRAASGSTLPGASGLAALGAALLPAVAAACPTCAREESPLRAWLVVVMMVAPLAIGAAAAFVLSRMR